MIAEEAKVVMKRNLLPSCMMVVVLLGSSAGRIAAQVAEAPAKAGMVSLNFADDVDLKVLIDYVSKRQGINFIYDEQIGARKITIKTSQPIPADSLLTLLDSALKMKGLSLSKSEVPGMMRIELAKSLTASSAGPQAKADDLKGRPTTAVTRVFDLKHTTVERAAQVLTPFLSSQTANLTGLADAGVMIVTDYSDNIGKLEELLTLVDRPGRAVSVKFVKVEHMEAEPMAQKITAMLAGKAKARGVATTAAAGVTVVSEERTNQLAIMGAADETAQVLELIQSIDVPLGVQTRVYQLAVVPPEQIDRIIKKLIGDVAAKRIYKSASEPDANMLIVTTTPEIHDQVESLRLALDKPREESQSPVRFYKLENAKAVEVLSTLQSLEGDEGLDNVSIDGLSSEETPRSQVPIRGPSEAQPNPPVGRIVDEPLPYVLPREVREGVEGGAGPAKRKSLKLRDAKVIADEATNTVIVVAKPAAHLVYEKLIKRLDIRRPQVLVEATVLALDTSDGFALGVELHSNTTTNGKTLLNFTKFGLTTPNSLPGNLTLSPGIGFTGALLKADIAEVVIKALENDSRVKVMSKPSVLINDNATGSLLSEIEEPYSSVNASTTVATTSFAGYSSAGTNIRVSPQISEGDYLKLKYEITLSSFGEDGSDELPPSRQKNTLASEATIPDGYTIVVGGLTRESQTSNIDRVPFLGRVPVLEYLLSSRSTSNSRTTLFVFIRAVVLRDDKFKDLKVISGVAASQAGLPGDFPRSEPVTTD